MVSRRQVLAGGVGVAASLLLPQAVRAAEPPVIRYATAGGLGPNEIETVIFSPWMQKNVLSRVGKEYSLEIIFSTTPQVAMMLAAGQIDMGVLTPPVFASSVARNTVPNGMKFVSDCYQDGREGYASQGFYVLEDSPIRSPRDLVGKVVGVNALGSTPDVMFNAMMSKNGIDPRKDLQVVEIPFPSIGPALRAKRVDCGVLPLPFGATERAKGGIRLLFSGQDVLPPFVVIGQVASNDILAKSPAAVKALLADYVDGLRWLYDPKNRAQAVKVTAEVAKSPEAVVDSYFLTRNDYYRDPNARISADLVQPIIDAMVTDGLLAKRIDMANYVDMSYLPAPR